MSDWLERELRQGLAPAAAPDSLSIRLGLTPAKRSEISRGVLTVAAAVVMIVGGGYAASRYSALDIRSRQVVEVAVDWHPAGRVQLAKAWQVRCDGGASLGAPLSASNATVVLAHSPHARAMASSSDAGCHACHSL